MEATQTANGMYSYDTLFNGHKLSDLVQLLHQFNCVQNGWKFIPLRHGAFGFDNLAICIAYTISKINKSTTIEEIADLVHKAWIINYVFWRDNKPWIKQKSTYFKANKPLSDERRNLCASQKYSELPKEEQEKDLIIAKWIYTFYSDL